MEKQRNFETQQKLEVKAYTKGDLRYLLADATVDLATRKNEKGERVVPISPKKMKSWIFSFLPELGLTADEYNSIRIFSQKQVAIIFNELL